MANAISISDPKELAKFVDKGRETWEAAREQLFDGRIPAWLRAIGYEEIVKAWEDQKEQFEDNHDAGLEAFLQLLSPNIAKPKIDVNPLNVGVIGIQPGQTKNVTLTVSNKGRGHLSGVVELDPKVEGLSVKPNRISANKTLDLTTTITVTMNAEESLSAKSSVTITSNGGTVKIPVSFKCKFPLVTLLVIWVEVITAWVVTIASLIIPLMYLLSFIESSIRKDLASGGHFVPSNWEIIIILMKVITIAILALGLLIRPEANSLPICCYMYCGGYLLWLAYFICVFLFKGTVWHEWDWSFLISGGVIGGLFAGPILMGISGLIVGLWGMPARRLTDKMMLKLQKLRKGQV